ncbi:neutral zinc metallopeptidase [Spiractinospora alimapuensis]|uniref:neutral zinc metallopeptidase n=1 Tax=Spiractinospora alimapuensis TaxID=2820884 RepID=UPI001F2F6B57|nr:neutral zinc metallopeptidase [Spiractinospora alimapuensis]QVQ52417.1 neutral zinc metallopeptidase [Spiractinospora alimapuensis]
MDDGSRGSPAGDGSPVRWRGRAALLWGGLGAFSIAVVVAGLALLVPTANVASTPQDTTSPRDFAPAADEAPGGSARNPLYDSSVPDAIDCPIPNLDPRSRESWEPFVDRVGGCLEDVWRPALEDLGEVPEPPLVTLEEGAGPQAQENGDGTEGTDSDAAGPTAEENWQTLASYHHGEITVMLGSVTSLAAAMADSDEEAVWLTLIAHEYAHYLQENAGILEHAWSLEQETDSEEEATEIRRRGELQADCLAGVALRSLGYEDEATIATVTTSLLGGDSPTHGSSDNRRRWLMLGWHAETLSDCNTYAAEPDFVR